MSAPSDSETRERPSNRDPPPPPLPVPVLREVLSPFRYTHRSTHVCVHRDRDTNNQPLMERGTWNRGSATKDVERGPCCRGAQRLDREEEFIVMGKLLMHTNFSPSFDDWKEKKKKMFEISRDREGISQRQKRERKKEEEEKKSPKSRTLSGRRELS